MPYSVDYSAYDKSLYFTVGFFQFGEHKPSPADFFCKSVKDCDEFEWAKGIENFLYDASCVGFSACNGFFVDFGFDILVIIP